MTQDERLNFLLTELLNEESPYKGMEIPAAPEDKKALLRSLMNVRRPIPIGDSFLKIQDAYLHEELKACGITHLADLEPVSPNTYLWQGDITVLEADAIVNAANSQMLGCFIPCHKCIDNAIHTFAGIQLRLFCAGMMRRQGHAENAGQAKITPSFNLPGKYIIHTVGPIIHGRLTAQDCRLLEKCYYSCLELAEQHHVDSIAFCCISTGEFCFPNAKAAQIAINTVQEYREQSHSKMKVIFNVFKETDYEIYKKLLRTD